MPDAAVSPASLAAAADAVNADWRTTDAEEIARRRQRAREEAPRVENRDRSGRFPIFSDFDVHSPSGASYVVEILDVARREFACGCVDFRVNGLGACKHVEAVLLHLERELGLDLAAAAGARTDASDRVDLVVDHEAETLRVERNRDRLPAGLRRLFNAADGRLERSFSPDLALELWAAAAPAQPEMRVSHGVAAWLECRRHEAESFRLRREYEENVQAGRWPAHETRRPLFPYQREGMLHLACTERALLADEIGLGKTAQALAACALLNRIGRATRALVVAPASLRGEWEEQIDRFTVLGRRALDGGSRAQRLEALSHPEPPFFTLVSYEQVAADGLELNARLHPDIVVLDEAQRLKNWNSRLALAVKRLESRYAFVLTGGPPDARLDELYSLVSFLDPTVLGPLFRFNREYYKFDARGRPAGLRNLDQLRERVRPLILRRRKADVGAQLPSRTDRPYLVPLPEAARDRCRGLEASLRRVLASVEKIPTGNADALHERLGRELLALRLAAGGLDVLPATATAGANDADPARALAACPKLRELARVLRECVANPDTKVLVFSEWETTLDAARALCLRLRLPFAYHAGSIPADGRREEVRRFRADSECRVFLSTDLGGPGLHLPEASVVIHLDQSWSGARMEARVARAWQPELARPVTVLHLLSEHTIEHRLYLARHGQLDPDDENGLLDPQASASLDPRERLLQKLQRLLPERTGARVAETSEKRPRPNPPPPAAPDPQPATPDPLPASPRHPEDRPREFVRRAAALLGGALVSGEERFPSAEDVPSVLFLTVETGQADSARRRLEPLAQRFFGPAAERAAAERAVRLEILDREDAALLDRLSAAGVYRDIARVARPLYPLEANGARPGEALPADAPPPLSEEAQARAAAERDNASRRLRTARVLLAEDMNVEARGALVGAILALGRALAVENRQPAPASAEEAVASPLAAFWPPRVLAGVQDFVGDEGAAPEPALEAMSRAPLAPEPPRAAREFFAGIKAKLAAL